MFFFSKQDFTQRAFWNCGVLFVKMLECVGCCSNKGTLYPDEGIHFSSRKCTAIIYESKFWFMKKNKNLCYNNKIIYYGLTISALNDKMSKLKRAYGLTKKNVFPETLT